MCLWLPAAVKIVSNVSRKVLGVISNVPAMHELSAETRLGRRSSAPVPGEWVDATRTHYDQMASGLDGRYQSRFDPTIFDRFPKTRENFRRFFEMHIGPVKPEVALDLGCGTGLYHPVLAPLVGKLYGVDNSHEMLERAKEVSDKHQLDTELILGSAEDLPFPDGTFDMVIAYDVLHHIADIPRIVEEIHRVLKPGGRFLGAETTMLFPWVFAYNLLHREEWGAFRIRPGYLRRAFRQFAEFHLRPDNTRFFPHARILDRTFGIVERCFLRGPLKMIAARYVIEARAASAAGTH